MCDLYTHAQTHASLSKYLDLYATLKKLHYNYNELNLTFFPHVTTLPSFQIYSLWKVFYLYFQKLLVLTFIYCCLFFISCLLTVHKLIAYLLLLATII